MKTLIRWLSASALVLTSSTTLAGHFYDYAKVTRVTPVYEQVRVSEPVRSCYPVHTRSRHHGPATLTGAIVGGVIGNVIGDNRASTVAGALIGGAVAHSSQHRVREHCEVRYERVRTVRERVGYDVRYRYKGQGYETFMQRHPGERVKVRVKVTPAG